MGEGARKKRDDQSEGDYDRNFVSDLRGKVYKYWATLLAVGLIVLGFGIIYWEPTLSVGENWHHLIRDIGIAAFVSGLLGIAYEFLLRKQFIEVAKDSLEALYEDRQQFNRVGLKRVYERLDPDLLREKCHNLSSIRILQTWLGHDRDTIKLIRQAATEGCNVRILLLDPFSAQVRYRASALVGSEDKDKIDEDGYKIDEDNEESAEKRVMAIIDDHLTKLCKIRRDNKQKDGNHNVEVYVYDAAPTIQIYEFDRTKIIGMYWRKNYTVEGPQFETVDSETSPLAKIIDDHFEDLWEDNSTRSASEALEEYRHWERTGFTLNGFTLEEHRHWKSTGFTLEEYRGWKSTGFTLEEYRDWKSTDFTLEQYRGWRKIDQGLKEQRQQALEKYQRNLESSSSI